MFPSNSYNDIFERSDGSYRYRGVEQLGDMNDASDVVDEMHFIIQTLARQDPAVIQRAVDEFHRCKRGDQPWPAFMGSPGFGPV
jgi:hypothetical protein